MLKLQMKKMFILMVGFVPTVAIAAIVYLIFQSLLKSVSACYIAGILFGFLSGSIVCLVAATGVNDLINNKIEVYASDLTCPIEEVPSYKRFWVTNIQNKTFVKEATLYKWLALFIIPLLIFTALAIVLYPVFIQDFGSNPAIGIMSIWFSSGPTYWIMGPIIFNKTMYRICKQCHSVNGFIYDKMTDINSNTVTQHKSKNNYETIGAVYQNGKRIDTITQYSGTTEYEREIYSANKTHQYRCACCGKTKKEVEHWTHTGDWKQK